MYVRSVNKQAPLAGWVLNPKLGVVPVTKTKRQNTLSDDETPPIYSMV